MVAHLTSSSSSSSSSLLYSSSSYLALPFLVFLLILSSTILLSAGQCLPGDNCKLPDCRCPQDSRIPGNLVQEDTPQMVLVSFNYAVNSANRDLYESIFEDIMNPNDCPAKGTLFVQKTNSDFTVIKDMYDEKHEVGVTSADGTIPTSGKEWSESFTDVKVELEKAGIPANAILGARSPELFVGGNEQFDAIQGSQLVYDSSCASTRYITSVNVLWPYTYDFVDNTPKCSSGTDPTQSYKGIWQFLIPDLEVDGTKCATPSSCSPFINSTQEAFDLLFNAFSNHYEGNRSPFVLYIDPVWLTVPYQTEGTKEFLQFIRAGFDDTWIITNQQALAWIQDPTPSESIQDFKPWQC